MIVPPLLDELLRAHGAPGGEEDVHAIVRREAASVGADITTDVLGGTIARVRGGSRTIALAAHTDQVAVGIMRIDEDGLLQISPLGVWKPSDAVGQPFAVKTRQGFVPAIGVRRGTGELTWEDVRLDVGVSTRAEAAELVSPGDAGVFVGGPVSLGGRRFTSPAIDNRAAVYAGLELLRRFAAAPAGWSVALAATVQEESSRRTGSEGTLASIEADVTIVLEGSYASDAPSGYPAWGESPLGGGPLVFRGPVVHPAVSGGLLAAAGAIGVTASVETGTATLSDGDDLFVAGGGRAVALISIPVRYMHTAYEVADLGDVEALVAVVEQFVRTLPVDASFLR
ncbi:MAG: hypothetical protein U0R50_12235 [Gaiellales bacterium]